MRRADLAEHTAELAGLLVGLQANDGLHVHMDFMRQSKGLKPSHERCLIERLLSVGEETGHLDAMFNRMADIYEVETRTAIRRFTSLFEPMIILVMGVVVGTLILSLMLAITSINDVAV